MEKAMSSRAVERVCILGIIGALAALFFFGAARAGSGPRTREGCWEIDLQMHDMWDRGSRINGVVCPK